MSDGNSVINLGDLAKPATVLIEKISAAIGVVYEPHRLKRMAKAEMEAEKIRALARIELTDIEQRAMERLIHQESRKQSNIESIAAQAAAELPQSAKPESLEEDWIVHFFKQCETISDKEMQSLWAKLLAGEATTPGTFSRRTVDFVSTMDKRDAALFTNFCQFVWDIGGHTPVVFDVKTDVYQRQGLHFDGLNHLAAIGLITFQSMGGYNKTGFNQSALIFYHDRLIQVDFPDGKDRKLEVGQTLLTSIGRELAPLCGAAKNDEFFQYVLEQWCNEGMSLSSPLAARR